MTPIKRLRLAYIIISSAIIVLGLVTAVLPTMSDHILCRLTGLLLMILGITKFIGFFTKDLYNLAFQFDFAFGIFMVIVGALILIHVGDVINIFTLMVGVVALADGLFKLQTAADAKKFGLKLWWYLGVVALLACLGGLLVIIRPFPNSTPGKIIFGLTLSIAGMQNLVASVHTISIAKIRNRE